MATTKKKCPQAPTPLPVWASLGISAGAGCGAWMVVHPMELLKNKVMLNPQGTSLGASVKDVFQGGLYKGLSGGLTRQVVYTTFRLGLYLPIRDLIVDHDTPISDITVFERAAAGASAGAIASFFSSPVEVCLVMQTKSATPLSLVGAAREVVAGHGIKGFWSGGMPLMTRAAIVGISQVAMYDQTKAMLFSHHDAAVAKARDNKLANPETNNDCMYSRSSVTSIAGLITGLFYATVTLPIEMSRVRMSAWKVPGVDEHGPMPNMVKAFGRIVKQEGLTGTVKAFIPYYGRCATHTLICFQVIEFMTAQVRASGFV